MRVSMPNFFTRRLIPASVLTMFLLKDFKSKNTIKCASEEEEDFSIKEGAQNFVEDNDPELSGDEEFTKMLADPSISDEERAMLRRQLKQQSIQPFPFSKLHAPFKLGVEEEKWNGVRGVLEWSPNQINKMEYTLIVDNKKLLNNYKMSVMSIIPFSERSQNGAFLIGRKEGDQSLGLQCHLNLSETSKILLVSSHPKPDLNQGHYVFEYSHDFERLNTTVKMSNMETSVSACAALYKNIFVGFEAVKHPKALQFLYNYGLCVKPSPQNKFGFALSYISAYPAVSFDLLYNISRQWTSYLSLSKNWHPMAAMGGQGSEVKMTHVYSQKDKFDSNVEVDINGLFHFYHTHQLTKNIGVQVNLELNPFAKWDKKNKKVFRSFGVGIKYATSSIEEEITNIQPEESFEEYEFDKIATDNIK